MPENDGPDTLESLGRNCLRLRWRIDALDRWREGLEKRVAVLESEIVTEREARTIRELLDKRNQRDHAIRFTRAQIAAGIVVGAVAIADFIVRVATLGAGH